MPKTISHIQILPNAIIGKVGKDESHAAKGNPIIRIENSSRRKRTNTASFFTDSFPVRNDEANENRRSFPARHYSTISKREEAAPARGQLALFQAAFGVGNSKKPPYIRNGFPHNLAPRSIGPSSSV